MARRESLVEKKRRADERKALCDELSSAIKVVSKRRERGGRNSNIIYIYIYSFFIVFIVQIQEDHVRTKSVKG